MKGNLWISISSHPFFTFLAGVASLISLFISISNDKFLIWILLTLLCIIVLQIWYLITENSKVLRNTNLVIGEMNSVKLDVFESSIELEPYSTGDYISKTDLCIAISSVCTPEKMVDNPFATIKIQYPSQLKMKFNCDKGIKKIQAQANNACSFTVELGQGIKFITLSSILVEANDGPSFKDSSKEIEIQLTSESFENKIVLGETVIVEDLGW